MTQVCLLGFFFFKQKTAYEIVAALALVGFTLLGGSMVWTRDASLARTSLQGSAPSWANSKNYVGKADPSADIGFRLYLGWNNPSAVGALAQAVSDPHNASYGQYLTPAQFRQRFAPSQAQVGAVQSWLRSQGFSVEYTPTNGHYVSAVGTVGQAEVSFGARFGMDSVHGPNAR